MFRNFDSDNINKLWKHFLVLFLISFLIINWDSVSWIFNYKAVSGIMGNFFQKEKTVVPQNLSKENEGAKPLQKSGVLEIPKLGIFAPLVFVDNSGQVQKSLDRGVVHWPDSALPGKRGQTLILGHSAPPNWPKIKYEWVFSRISELKTGDEISVTFNDKKYSYSVTRQIFLDKGEQIPENQEGRNQNLYLITCWPPGKDIRRLAVEAQFN
ncbi:MAG: class E sortase [Elusimicrobiota bacterium]